MRRVLLLLENFNEQTELQSTFQRLGFVVESINSVAKIQNALVEFNSQILIAQGAGKKIHSELVAAQLAKVTRKPQVMLVFPSGRPPQPADFRVPQFSGVIVSPLDMEKAIVAIAKASGIDSEPLLEKYERIKTSQVKPEDEMNIVKSKNGKSVEKSSQSIQGKFSSGPIHDPNRAKKYANVLANSAPSKVDGIPKDIMAKNVKKLREEEAKVDNSSLENERSEFVKAMFKK